jgi:hypothetical protein
MTVTKIGIYNLDHEKFHHPTHLGLPHEDYCQSTSTAPNATIIAISAMLGVVLFVVLHEIF